MPMSTKRKAPTKLAAPVARSAAKFLTKSTIDESRTCVSGTDALQSSQVETIVISSDEASEEDVSDADEVVQADGAEGAAKPDVALARVNSSRDKPEEDESDGETTSPSFGELLRDNEVIDVPALLQQAGTMSTARAQRPRTAIVPPSHQSLTTVLSQALRTDDTELLESCLHTTNFSTIRTTIERLDSSLAGSLLSKLAGRLYRRPGRAGNLMIWVRWSLVAHGGALASQPQVVQSLNSLQKVLTERAKGLNSLLALKGKLDLLEGQMDLRKQMKRRPGLLQHGDGDDGEEDVVWVEGETDATGGKGLRRRGGAGDGDEEDDDDDVPATNGFVGDSDDDEQDDLVDEDDEDESEGGAEPVDEDEVDHEDVDESVGEEEESDIETGAPPSKAQKVSRALLPRRK
ncbi:U3 small nucleolar RNA-associated protein 5 [Ophiocordyceps sinensis CO18]|uniref:U3 small nucleolar RNA-associated protein 5 n=1 Tax=Ophiocordyceps sinensis (strain Co18 / CGMCC 3.14243) TaxID=911162 RepID=T5AHM9_OPHSC|nr:U3 small nucleolar RNA-associated protein 5 [Ophiocordyceps sinensis CO18]